MLKPRSDDEQMPAAEEDLVSQPLAVREQMQDQSRLSMYAPGRTKED